MERKEKEEEEEDGGEEAAAFRFFFFLEAVQTEQSVLLCLQTVRAQRGVQRLRPVDPSQRNGDEGAGKCLPPQGKSPDLTSVRLISHCLFDRNIWDLVERDSQTGRYVPTVSGERGNAFFVPASNTYPHFLTVFETSF